MATVITPSPSRTNWLALDTETTPGTDVSTPAAAVFIPILPGSMIDYDPEQLTSSELRGIRADTFVYMPGVNAYAGKISGQLTSDMALAILRMAWGKDTVSQPDAVGSPTVYYHDLSREDTNNLIACTAWFNTFNTADKIEQFGWVAVSKLTIKFDAAKDFLGYQADIIARSRTVPTLALPTPTFAATKPHQGWTGSITKGGSAFYGLQDFEFTIDNGASGEYTVQDSQDASFIAFDAMKVSAKGTLVGTVAEYEKFTSATEEALVVDFLGDLISSTYYNGYSFSFPKLNIAKGQKDNGGKYIKLKFDYMPIAGASGADAVTCRATNTRAASYY